MRSNAVSYISNLFSNPVFLSATFSWFVAQLIKTVIDFARNRFSNSRDVMETLLWRTGGMPSSHSSTVTAIATSIAFTEGIQSPIFIIAFFYGLVTIRDALGVRRASGLQARAINQLGNDLKEKMGIDFNSVKEVHGHTPTEVAVGIFLGFFIAVAFSIL